MLLYKQVKRDKTNKTKQEEQIMKRITINNGTMTRKKAIEIAKQYNKETGKSVEVCNMVGDTVLYLK